MNNNSNTNYSPRYGTGFDSNGELFDYCVYIHTCLADGPDYGKHYVGITNNVKQRWTGDGRGYCGKFKEAIDKYGWNNFSHEVVIDNVTPSMALLIEEELITKYDTKDNGFNTVASSGYPLQINYDKMPIHLYTFGGYYYRSYKSINDAAIDFNKSPNDIYTYAMNGTFSQNYYWEFQFKPKIIPRIRKGDPDDLLYPILKVDLFGNIVQRYNNVYEISEDHRDIRTYVLQSCRFEVSTYAGYIWIFDGYDRDKVIKQKLLSLGTAVDQYTQYGKFVKTYYTLAQAAECVPGADASVIIRICRKGWGLCAGYQWKYHGEKPPKVYLSKDRRGILIQCDPITHEHIKAYYRIEDIMKEFNMQNISAIWNVVNGIYKKTKDFYWEFIPNEFLEVNHETGEIQIIGDTRKYLLT